MMRVMNRQAKRGGPSQSSGMRPLQPAALRWRCDPTRLPFEDTTQVEPMPGVIGQDTAIDALRFGLETRAPGQNVFVRGLAGTGRMTLIRRQLEELRPTCPLARDRCYVHDFAQPDRPRLISRPRGRGRAFEHAVDELADFVRDDLGQALGSERTRSRKAAIDQAAHDQVRAVVEPFEKSLEEAGLALVSLPVGPVAHSVIFPVVDGKPVTPEEFELLHEQGKVGDEQYRRYGEQRQNFENALAEVNQKIHLIGRKHAETVGPMIEGEARAILREFVWRIESEFPDPAVKQFVKEIVDDVAERSLHKLGEGEDFTRRYRVNVVLAHGPGEGCAIIIENAPTMTNLLGTVDREVGPMGAFHSDHLMIRAGSILRADGGYLIIEAREVLSEPGAWKVLLRTLRTSLLEIVPPEMSLPWGATGLKPEAIDIDVKVILVGDANIYYLLDAIDPDFPHLFKVLADFDSVIPRDDQGIGCYAGVLARIARDENLPPLDRTAVAALVEHGARIAARAGKLTARFGRVADLAREGAYIARKRENGHVTGEDVREAIRRTKRRADLPSRRFRELLADGTINMQAHGSVVGQVNGLAVLHAGPLTYGFPARITATIGPGTAGVINIEREAALSGAIHTKGFYILGGLLRYLLQANHPLAFDASIAFEQSYGGIDGDSASGAEICCLLSALTVVPIRQDVAMTGAIDQVEHILSVGAVNEKIEGFFDVCRDLGFSGTQGVIIPAPNAGDLMLRDDVVEACAAGQFHVWAVGTIHEALELLTGMPAGVRGGDGKYPEGSLLARAVDRAQEFWLRAATPTSAVLMRAEREEEEEAVPPAESPAAPT
jgi:predicted ATP-dependent protease